MANERSPSLFALADGVAMRSGDFAILLARLAMGWMFLTSAWGALLNVAGATAYFASLGLPAADLLVWPALLGEMALGIGLILGLATRYVALGSFVFIAITIVLAHRYWTFPPPRQGAEYAHFCKNLALMGGALMLFWSGAGRYSVDAKLR